LGTARAQAQFDKSAAMRSYQQLLEIWKNADADFIPAQEAKREMAALQGSSWPLASSLVDSPRLILA